MRLTAPTEGFPIFIISDISLKTRLFGLHFCVKSLGIFSTTVKQCAPKVTEFAEITQNNGHYAVQGHSKSPILIPIESSLCDFLLVINTNLPPVYAMLHRCQDVDFDRSKIATPLVFNSPDRGVPLGRSPRNFSWMSADGQRTKCRRNIAENFNLLTLVHPTPCARALQTDRRQTNGRATAERT